MMQDGGEIVGGEKSLSSRRRPAIASAIVANRVKMFAEFRPHIIPHRRVEYPIVDQDDCLRRTPAFFEVQFRGSHLNEGPRYCFRVLYSLRPHRHAENQAHTNQYWNSASIQAAHAPSVPFDASPCTIAPGVFKPPSMILPARAFARCNAVRI